MLAVRELALERVQDDDRGHAVERHALGDPGVLGDVLGVRHEDRGVVAALEAFDVALDGLSS